MKWTRAIGLGIVIAAFVGAMVYRSTVRPADATSATSSTDAGAAPEPSAPASAAVVVVDAAVAAEPVDAGDEDAGEAAIAHGVSDGKPLPPLAAGAVWSVVRWDMTRAQIEEAFTKAGTTPRARGASLAVKGGGWEGTVSFSANKPIQIDVVGGGLSKEAAASVTAKMRERGGAPARTSARIEERWKKPGAGTVTLVAAGSDGAWTTREEYVRDGGAGAVGFAPLTWGMAPAAAEQGLTGSGWSAHVVKASAAGVDPCSMPDAPPDCAKKAAAKSVVFTKGEREGTASFAEAGLVQVVVSGPVADEAAALGRGKEIEAALGKAKSIERSTKTQHADASSKIELEVRERQPDGTFTVLETYRPKK
jgi:hypothetical protein